MKQCTVTLSGKDYKVRTLADALRAKTRTGTQVPPIAATTEVDNGCTTPALDLVAAIFSQGAMLSADKTLSNSSDTSVALVSAAPLKGKHFIWTCRLKNAVDRFSLKTKALIDGGAHMVLIHPDVATRLALPKFPLSNPKQVNVAMVTSQKIEKLTHYITLEPSSLDGLFSSHPLHAVIAPGLCMPIILGLPFLTVNKIICNYVARQCMATENEPPYNLLSKSRNQTALSINTNTPDILAALKERIITLSFEEELEAREAEI